MRDELSFAEILKEQLKREISPMENALPRSETANHAHTGLLDTDFWTALWSTARPIKSTASGFSPYRQKPEAHKKTKQTLAPKPTEKLKLRSELSTQAQVALDLLEITGELIGVSHIKGSYRRLAKKHHPDRNSTQDQKNIDLLLMYTEAYETLLLEFRS